MNDRKAVFKKVLFVFGRICTLLSVAFAAIYLLWYTSYPVYHFLSATPGLSLFFFDDAIILPFTAAALCVTVTGVANILFYRKELPVGDHFLSLMQIPLLIFGVGIVRDCVDKTGDRFSLWSPFALHVGQVSVIVYFALLALTCVLMARNTKRYALGGRARMRLMKTRREDRRENAAA
ncbi:MAG: hypothetical protein IJL26_09600 [Clostridia bacterium]|nr:hypothetical protein [Clostridia bacterium]